MRTKTVTIKYHVKSNFGFYFCTDRKSEGLYLGTVMSSMTDGIYGALRQIRIVGPHDEVELDEGTTISVRWPTQGHKK